MKVVVRHSYRDGEIFETRSLRFHPFSYEPQVIHAISEIIAEKLTPDLLTKKYREENATNPMYGHCYHSTQALFYLMGTDKLVPMSGIDYRNDTHWWLQDGETIHDVTADQYYSVGQVPPYATGKKTAWYGWKQRPHQRSLKLIMRVLDSMSISYCYEILKPQSGALTEFLV
jgi:hypothetical protein